MKTNYRSSLTAGIVFGIVTIFLFLIGFTGTAAGLLGKALHLGALAPALGLSADMFNLMLFLGLMGILAGANGVHLPKGATNPGRPWCSGQP